MERIELSKDKKTVKKKVMAKKKKQELGLGIRALLSNIDSKIAVDPKKVVKELSSAVAQIKLSAIETNPDQPRTEFDEDALKELSQSIKSYGLIQPVTVRRLTQKTYQLISGERRVRASKMAGLKEIPAYVRITKDEEMLELALVENIQRENLNAIEVAITYQRLIDECNLTHAELSKRIGKNRSTVTNFMRLLKLPPQVQSAIKNKSLTMGHARALSGVDDLSIQLSVFKEIKQDNLSVRATEELIRTYSPKSSSGKKAKKKKPSLPEEYRRIQNDLSDQFETRVTIKRKSTGKGQIIINFDNDIDFNRVLDNFE